MGDRLIMRLSRRISEGGEMHGEEEAILKVSYASWGFGGHYAIYDTGCESSLPGY